MPKEELTLEQRRALMPEHMRKGLEEMEGKIQSFENNPEAQKEAFKSAAEVKELIKKLPDLDFSDLESVLDWLYDFQAPSDNQWVHYELNDVLKPFNDHGFEAREYSVEKDADSAVIAKQIVESCLAGISQRGKFHQVARSIITKWKTQSGKQAQADAEQLKNLRESL